MAFRWVALIALWTLLSGPILSGYQGVPDRATKQPSAATECVKRPAEKLGPPVP
jgi:hypothetical protein